MQKINMNNINLESSKFLSEHKEFTFDLENLIVTDINILEALSTFWKKEVQVNLLDGHLILIQFKVRLETGLVRTISYVQTVGNKDYDELLESFLESWSIKSEEYHTAAIKSLIFEHRSVLDYTEVKKSKISKHKSVEIKPTFNFGGYNLPNNMNIQKWGEFYLSNNNLLATVYKPNSKAKYIIQISGNCHTVELKIKDRVILKFKDIMIEENNLSTFTRKMNNQEYTFKNGEMVLKKITRNTQFLAKVQKSAFISNKFITMDLETRIIKDEMQPYCVSIYDGKILTSFYLSNFKNSDDLLKNAVSFLMKREYHQYKVYLHNFSYFDGVFLLKILSELSNNIKPIIRDGRIIDLRFNFKYSNSHYSLYFRDSYLLLPSSLSSLAKNFNVEKKGIFPYLFVNNENTELDYNGLVPKFEMFPKISKEDYLLYCKEFENKTWSLKEETIKYCELDVLILYSVIDKFKSNIFKLFRVEVLKYPTLSSLSFAIFRSNFIGEAKIPLIHGEMYNFFKKGYTGGSVDVFKPYGKNIYRYDVNSLYPYVMKMYDMPVGSPTYFEGDISAIENKPFGIFEVEVIAPSDIKIPLLQLKYKSNSGKGTRTIAPLGTWTGVYFSDELYNAMKYGYKVKVLRGYTFKKGNIFTEFVDYLYDLKVKSKKGSSDYTISKLVLNSLYGRLGMNPEIENHKIVNSQQALSIYAKYRVQNSINLQNGKELISFFDDFNTSDFKKVNLNISIPISLVVTASARIHMSQFKNLKDTNLYYTDTDSIDIDRPLSDSFVSDTELGKMKLEHEFKEVVFLAPKVYGGITSTYEYTKVKGLKNAVNYVDLLPLLHKDKKLEVNQEKWYRDFSKGAIRINNEIYTLMITDNKRNLVFDSDGKFVGTTPITI